MLLDLRILGYWRCENILVVFEQHPCMQINISFFMLEYAASSRMNFEHPHIYIEYATFHVPHKYTCVDIRVSTHSARFFTSSNAWPTFCIHTLALLCLCCCIFLRHFQKIMAIVEIRNNLVHIDSLNGSFYEKLTFCWIIIDILHALAN